jgi:hypothetical protein
MEIFNSRKKTARFAGLIYFIVVISGLFSLMYVPSQLIEWSSASTTVANIRESQLMYKFGAVAEIFCYVAFLVLPLILFKLFEKVNKEIAFAMILFVVAGVSISYLAIADKFDVISLLATDQFTSFSALEIENLVMLNLESYHNTILIAQVFWGLWLFPFGYLVYKSGFLPKILGVFLMLGCLGYFVEFLGEVFIENYFDTLLANIAMIPSAIGELGTCLWLLIVGAKKEVQD